MKNVVLHSFTDKADTEAKSGENVYWKGSTYPRDGYTPTKERIAQLSSNANAQKRPVISVPKEEK